MVRHQRRRRFPWLRGGMFAIGIIGLLAAAGAAILSILGQPKYPIPQPTVELEATPARVARGKRLVSMLCWRCHFDPQTGGFTGRRLDEISRRVGQVSAPNITQHPDAGIGTWSAGELAVLLRTGIHPKLGRLVAPSVMPRWPGMADDDLKAVLVFLRSDDPWVAPRTEQPPTTRYSVVSKYHALVDWSALPYPRAAVLAPDPNDLEQYGRYWVDQVLQCAACHSERWAQFDVRAPGSTPGYLAGGATTSDINGVALSAANLTPHETGLKGWTAEALRRALIGGFGPDHRVIRWPMPRYAGLDPSDVEAIYAYLHSLAPVEHEVRSSPAYRVVGRKANEGRHLYLRYGCHYCHGEAGLGIADLRGAAEHWPTDDALIAYLKDPSRDEGLTLMPSWSGVIAEGDYPQLCAYIRELGASPEADSSP